MRQKLVAGNWKSNGSLKQNQQLIEELLDRLESAPCDLLVCPPDGYLEQVKKLLAGSNVAIGAQNCSAYGAGAYTGEMSAEMLVDLGVRYVILGHSERRSLFAETDELVADKVLQVAKIEGLVPVICLGESLEERESGKAEEVCLRQLRAALRVTPEADWVIAYEPVWAIGTGKTASAAEAQEMHSVLRRELQLIAPEVAEQIRILYGGSVKPANAEELFEQPDIDGALVGGASLSAEDFAAIAAATK